MNPTSRFRDSLPIRIGVGIVTAVVALLIAALVASYGFGFDGPVGASALWVFIWIILGLGFILVGIGQTIVRRRRSRGPG
jgi:hypothetical protein